MKCTTQTPMQTPNQHYYVGFILAYLLVQCKLLHVHVAILGHYMGVTNVHLHIKLSVCICMYVCIDDTIPLGKI